ncbi:hypothetical protein V1277_004668 [Bradyrhizobium sp. AZCC 1588]|uniref:PEPxxWA-CTERM sorting domain-containing protein n=1 Tax=unclassified Bradyrhizobium TaxID=2631580 RepID=UPI002FEE85B2
MRRSFQTAAIALLFATAFSPAQAVVVGTANPNPLNTNSAPFGSAQSGYIYQQVYDDSAFSSALAISELTFYNKVNPGGTPNSGNFRIYLSTTSQQVGAIANNIPDFSSATLVFDGLAPSVSDGELDFLLSTTFNYDPSSGKNLLMIVTNWDLSSSRSPLYLDSDTTNTVTSSRQYSGPNGPGGNLSTGLVTGFNEHVAAVPEPSTWAMMILGFVGVGFLTYRRRYGANAAA